MGLKLFSHRLTILLAAVGFSWSMVMVHFIIKVHTDDQGRSDQLYVRDLAQHNQKWADLQRAFNQSQHRLLQLVVRFESLLNSGTSVSLGKDAKKRTASGSAVSLPELLHSQRHKLQLMQVHLEAERERGRLKEEVLQDLRTDKLHLQQEVTRMEALIQDLWKDKVKKSSITDPPPTSNNEDCPLPALDGFPSCQDKIEWLKNMWHSDPCYQNYGVNGSTCSFLIYLSEVERWCPVLPGRGVPKEDEASSKMEVRSSLGGLFRAMGDRQEFKWVLQRIQSMEELWVNAGRSLSAKQDLAIQRPKRILVHMGLVTTASGFNIAETAFLGGPLGELVQWSDLISSLHVLGHQVHLSGSLNDLRKIMVPSNWSARPGLKMDLIYTDIVGLQQFKSEMSHGWVTHKCVIRVLDSFGTEPEFNHEVFATERGHNNYWGKLHLNPQQFYTMFPHTPDNSFLGFVVERQLSANDSRHLRSVGRQNQALVYGKKAEFWKGKRKYLGFIHNYTEIHGTVHEKNSKRLPSYVKNHGFLTGRKVQILLRESKLFVGLSFPYEGPAPLEAIANGCAFLNPRFTPPKSRRNTDFFKDKPTRREVTSQHPYAEAIGEPYVWTVDINNNSEVERAVKAILNQTIEPYLPYEFTCEGMLQRVNAFIHNQDFCHGPARWPPLSTLRVKVAEVGSSCKQVCQREGLICEPSYFRHLNSTEDLARFDVECETARSSNATVALPAFSAATKHCVFQSDALLFSCAGAHGSLARVCPCRDFIKDQVALCKDCL